MIRIINCSPQVLLGLTKKSKHASPLNQVFMGIIWAGCKNISQSLWGQKQELCGWKSFVITILTFALKHFWFLRGFSSRNQKLFQKLWRMSFRINLAFSQGLKLGFFYDQMSQWKYIILPTLYSLIIILETVYLSKIYGSCSVQWHDVPFALA